MIVWNGTYPTTTTRRSSVPFKTFSVAWRPCWTVSAASSVLIFFVNYDIQRRRPKTYRGNFSSKYWGVVRGRMDLTLRLSKGQGLSEVEDIWIGVVSVVSVDGWEDRKRGWRIGLRMNELLREIVFCGTGTGPSTNFTYETNIGVCYLTPSSTIAVIQLPH